MGDLVNLNFSIESENSEGGGGGTNDFESNFFSVSFENSKIS